MKQPIQYHQRPFQIELLRSGTREQILAWLVWNDLNGIYSDTDSAAEGYEFLTLSRARSIMQVQIDRD